MNEDHSDGRTARRAEEEIKNHGDKLGRQVNDAAGKPAPGRQSPDKEDKTREDTADG